MKRWWLVIGLLMVGVMLRPGLALAHVELVQSVPVAGAQLEESPAEIRLTFNNALNADSTFILFGERFQAVPGVTGRIDPQVPEQMVVRGLNLAAGTYTVQWTAADAADGHQLSGSYSFTVGTAAADTVVAEDGEMAAGWIVAVIGLVLVVGGGLFWRRQRGKRG